MCAFVCIIQCNVQSTYIVYVTMTLAVVMCMYQFVVN